MVLSLLGAGCASGDENADSGNTAPREFSFDQVQVGDKVVGMSVTNIEPAYPDRPLSGNNVRILFEGEKPVTGRLSFNETIGAYCLDVDENTVLPRLIENAYGTDFCFRANPMAEQLFDERVDNKVTVTIQNYEIVSLDGTGGVAMTANVADLKL